ncbi:30S ribosomal protein S9 [bacterium]|nr:30S ribosomal protein S9 [bacterium]|tara:strand:+ start:12124 stop:12531 length:408 start_codon:yes stop_codon:yes gene_type:complete
MATTKDKQYTEGVGKRKESVARVRITPAGKNTLSVNDKSLDEYFPTEELKKIVHEPIEKSAPGEKFSVSVKVSGGGIHSQAEAVRHGFSRALLSFDGELRKSLKKSGLLTRDARIKERRKFGKKKARKSPQWSKR